MPMDEKEFELWTNRFNETFILNHFVKEAKEKSDPSCEKYLQEAVDRKLLPATDISKLSDEEIGSLCKEAAADTKGMRYRVRRIVSARSTSRVRRAALAAAIAAGAAAYYFLS